MKKVVEEISVPKKDKSKTKIRSFMERQADKLRHYQFTCPFCKDTLNGLSAMGSHLKDHCT